jgi:hypothetical protein
MGAAIQPGHPKEAAKMEGMQGLRRFSGSSAPRILNRFPADVEFKVVRMNPPLRKR